MYYKKNYRPRSYSRKSKKYRSTNVPTHQDILAVWIYHNIIRQLDINKEEFEKYL